MKWFTREWATGQLSDEEADRVVPEYEAHLASISAKLPDSLREVAASLNIHDGHVKRWHQAGSVVEMEILAGDLQLGYRKITLTFEEASARLSGSTGSVDFDNPRTELLYDEFDLAENGLFEYRVLIWPEGELAVRFTSAKATSVPASPSDG